VSARQLRPGTEQAVARNHNQRVKAWLGGTVPSNLRADARVLEAFCIRGRCTARKVDEAVADKQLTSVAKSCEAEAFVLVFWRRRRVQCELLRRGAAEPPFPWKLVRPLILDGAAAADFSAAPGESDRDRLTPAVAGCFLRDQHAQQLG